MRPVEITRENYYFYEGDCLDMIKKWKTHHFFLPTSVNDNDFWDRLWHHRLEYILYESRFIGFDHYIAFKTETDLNAAKLLR